jgi:hypothetical protein
MNPRAKGWDGQSQDCLKHYNAPNGQRANLRSATAKRWKLWNQLNIMQAF